MDGSAVVDPGNSTVVLPVAPANGGTIIVGIIMGLTASVGINLGNNIQAVALSKMTRLGLEKKPRLWWMGTLLFAFASIINFAAFPFAPAAVLAPLESIQFVTNLLFARFVNKRKITWPMMFGSALVIGGTVLTILFGPNRVLEYPDVDAVALLWGNVSWIVYLCAALLFAFLLLAIHARYEALRRAGADGWMSVVVLPVTFAVSTAVFGSMCVVSAKCMGELVTIFLPPSSQYGEVLSHWFFYVTLLILLVCMAIWLGRLNAALRKYDPIFIIPLVQAHYIIFSILSGGFFFEEFALMTTALAWAMFVSGILVMLVGLAFLSPVSCFGAPEKELPDEYTPLKPDWDTSRYLLTFQPESQRAAEPAEADPVARFLRTSLGCCVGPAVDTPKTALAHPHGLGGTPRGSLGMSSKTEDPNKSAKWVSQNV